MTTYASCSIENNQIILNAALSYSFQDLQNMAGAERTVNTPAVKVRLLLDTGACSSCICREKMQIFKNKGMKPKRTMSISTPSTGAIPVQKDVYEMGFIIGGHENISPHIVSSIHLIETDFSAQNIDGLIGMDILKNCHISFSGIDKACFLSFHDVTVLTPANNVPPAGLEGDALREELAK